MASLDGAIAEDLVRHAVEEPRHSQRAERQMENLLEAAYDALGPGGHRQVKTIPGIGMRTAAALAAKIVDVDRFSTPEQLVNYFGTFPEEHTSGVDRRGNKVTKGTMLMSVKGNDLVRGHLWMASPRAYSTTPHFAPCMLASGRWAKVAGDAFAESGHRGRLSPGNPFFTGGQPTEQLGAALPQQGRRAVANPFAFSWRPIRPRRRAATGCSRQLGHRAWVDFAHVRAQITMEQVLSRLGVYDRLRGSGPQKRGPCPIHHSRQGSARPFCVHLGKSVFRCLNPSCAAHGNVLDLWAAVRGMELREAAIDLAQTFHLQLAATPKRRR